MSLIESHSTGSGESAWPPPAALTPEGGAVPQPPSAEELAMRQAERAAVRLFGVAAAVFTDENGRPFGPPGSNAELDGPLDPTEASYRRMVGTPDIDGTSDYYGFNEHGGKR